MSKLGKKIAEKAADLVLGKKNPTAGIKPSDAAKPKKEK